MSYKVTVREMSDMFRKCSGVLTGGGGGRDGRPERHLSKGRHIEVSKILVYHSVYKKRYKNTKIISAYLF